MWCAWCRGQAQNGELGYGPDGKKSSANPDKVHALEGVETHQVACGIGHTLFLVKPGSKQVCFCSLPASFLPHWPSLRNVDTRPACTCRACACCSAHAQQAAKGDSM